MIKNLNNYFNKIYCINLKRRADRWTRILKMFNQYEVDVQRIEAFDGNVVGSFNNLRAAQYGCFLSHKSVYEDAVKNNYEKILILEDDVYFDKNINSFDFNKLPEWDSLYLGASQAPNTHVWDVKEEKGYYYNNILTLGTFANAFKLHILVDILKTMENKNNINKPIDVYLARYIRDSKCVGITIFPNIIIPDVRNSDVSNDNSQIEHSQKMKWNLNNFDIIIESNVHKWDRGYSNLNNIPMFYGKTVTYELGNEFLKDCQVVEDWGTGGGGFKEYRKNAIGVDGSNTPFADKKFIDLTNCISNCDGIYMRHVLEHNYEWQKILHNAMKSARKKICLVMFIPFSDFETKQLAFNSIGVPDLSISKHEFYDIIKQYPDFKFDGKELKTNTQYGYEQIIYIEKQNKK
jgi:hypothetical protein